jgi:hypothetical protein
MGNAVESAHEGELSVDILAKAKAAGFDVTERQLNRLHSADLLPRPKQVWEKGKGGSVSLYPLGAADQLIALCAIRRKYRSTKDVGWWLWWLGFPVAGKYWQTPLEERAGWYDNMLPKVIRAIRSSIEDRNSQNSLSPLKTMRMECSRASHEPFADQKNNTSASLSRANF